MADLPTPDGISGQLSTIRLVASGQLLDTRLTATGQLATVRLAAVGQLDGYTNPVPSGDDALILEIGDYLLLESGDKLLLEG